MRASNKEIRAATLLGEAKIEKSLKSERSGRAAETRGRRRLRKDRPIGRIDRPNGGERRRCLHPTYGRSLQGDEV